MPFIGVIVVSGKAEKYHLLVVDAICRVGIIVPPGEYSKLFTFDIMSLSPSLFKPLLGSSVSPVVSFFKGFIPKDQKTKINQLIKISQNGNYFRHYTSCLLISTMFQSVDFNNYSYIHLYT